MLDQLMTHAVWAWPGVLAALVLGIRALMTDDALKRDLSGAARLLVFSFAAGAMAFFVPLGGYPAFGKFLVVVSALLAAFGCIRSGAGLLLEFWKRRRAVDTPKILRDVVYGALYVVAVMVVLRATLQIDLASLLTTSAILSVVLGLALQETLGNLFAGLSLQVEHPFVRGDIVKVGDHTGRIIQLGWRTTRIEMQNGSIVTLPNNRVAKEPVQNFSRSGALARSVTVGVSYATPPNRVRVICMETLQALQNVIKEPAPAVAVVGYGDSAIQYQISFFARTWDDLDRDTDELLTRLWYRFNREGIEIPFPQRTIHTRAEPPPAWKVAGTEREVDALALLSSVDFLAPLGDDGRRELARRVTRQTYGAGEAIVRQNAPGETFYMVSSGEVAVDVESNAGASAAVAKLRRGDFFGEMSLLTGEPRAATVMAVTDCELLCLDRAAFADLFGPNPEVCRQLSEVLGRRRAQIAAASRAANAEENSAAARAESSRIFGRLKDIFRLRGAAPPAGGVSP